MRNNFVGTHPIDSISGCSLGGTLLGGYAVVCKRPAYVLGDRRWGMTFTSSGEACEVTAVKESNVVVHACRLRSVRVVWR